jgi:WD repeat-containing protein 26
MCSDPEDLRQRAGWDGAFGTSRLKLLANLQRKYSNAVTFRTHTHTFLSGYIPPSVMIPQRRFSTLLNQASLYQRQRCVYHNSPTTSSSFSLFTDHQCDKSAFPRVTTTILAIHTDEVWNLEWSHDGTCLASASKDKSAIIWRIGVSISKPAPAGNSGLIYEWKS